MNEVKVLEMCMLDLAEKRLDPEDQEHSGRAGKAAQIAPILRLGDEDGVETFV